MRPELIVSIRVDVKEHMPNWAPLAAAINLDLRHHLFDALRPLPRDRELIPSEQRRALEQRRRREAIATRIARQLTNFITDKIVDAVEQNDSTFGYTREQWEQFDRPPITYTTLRRWKELISIRYSNPDIILMPKEVEDALKRNIPIPGNHVTQVDSLCGFPYEAFHSMAHFNQRLEELQREGKSVLVITE